MRQDGEPSVDQILRSIKNVMARESRRDIGGAPPAETPVQDTVQDTAQDAPPEPADADEAEEVLELTEPEPSQWQPQDFSPALAEETRLAEPEQEEPAADDLIEDEADGEAALDAETESSGDGGAQATPAGPPLTSELTGESMRRSLAALSMLAVPGAPLPNNPAGEAALDTLVREMLRPMLAQWLEVNLPPIVEREVRAEIARITGAGSR